MIDLKKQLEQEETKYEIGGRGNSFKFEKGLNTFRILTNWETIGQHTLGKNVMPVVCYGENEGCPYHGENTPIDEEGKPLKVRPRFLVYILDRKDDKVKLAFLPYTIIKSISDLSADPDWAFEDFPIPYDIKVTYDPEKSGKDIYSVIASPKRS